MPLFETNPKNNENTNQTDNCGFETNPKNQTPAKPENRSVMTMIGQLLPLAPFVFEQFTGQKVPQMTGTIAEIQMALVQISTNLQVVVNNQQQLAQRLIALETKLAETQTNANQHLTNLTHQFNSLRLTHTREKESKQIAYHNQPDLENNE